jgi:hypothetical protein
MIPSYYIIVEARSPGASAYNFPVPKACDSELGTTMAGKIPERDAMTLGSLVGRPAFTGT